MSDNNLHLELFKDANERFVKHLNIPNNERIIFSGKFGHGKTTFLREFFKGENQKKNFQVENRKYNVISLFPVNYSVASNEDIFRYIKYDIILEMLANNYQVEENTVSYLKTLPEFLKKNAHKVFASIIQMIPNVGKDIVESFERWDSLKNEFFKFHDAKNDRLNKSKKLIDYIEHFEKTDGTVFEDDIVTKLIEKILIEQKVKDRVEENVLIIDDLDRIDPEHIFRILNVFAAHFDRRDITKTKNKFGFDKIIVVCDVENIRQIFRHRYGIKTDFNGYIDKFYSNRIFEYDCGSAFITFLRSCLKNTGWEIFGTWHEHGTASQMTIFNYQYSFFLYQILDVLFNSKQLHLRNLIKLQCEKHDFKGYLTISNIGYETLENPLIFYLAFISKIKGGYFALKESINNLNLDFIKQDNLKRWVDFCLISWVYLLHGRRLDQQTHYSLSIDNMRLDLAFLSDTSEKFPPISYSMHGQQEQKIFTKNEFILLLNIILDYLYDNKVLQ